MLTVTALPELFFRLMPITAHPGLPDPYSPLKLCSLHVSSTYEPLTSMIGDRFRTVFFRLCGFRPDFGLRSRGCGMFAPPARPNRCPTINYTRPIREIHPKGFPKRCRRPLEVVCSARQSAPHFWSVTNSMQTVVQTVCLRAL